jgi:ABC-type branched-subunit amino acid transport system substrate-binding protein
MPLLFPIRPRNRHRSARTACSVCRPCRARFLKRVVGFSSRLAHRFTDHKNQKNCHSESVVYPWNPLFLGLARNLHSPQRCASRLLFLLCLLPTSLSAQTQTATDTTKPYATLDRENVTYRGPVRTAQQGSDSAAVIGMIVPLTGALQSEGKALLAAAQLAIEQENATGGLPNGKPLELVARDENGPWGQASMEILKLYDHDHALAILTSANGTSAHLAEQIANKISIPILTLSSDPSTTQANVPWLFRLGPSDTDQAQAFCQRIYRDLALKRVLLIFQMDHDGRIGATEFEKAVKAFHAAPPQRFEWNVATPNSEALRATLRANPPDAIVVWSDATTADLLMPTLQATLTTTPVFLCRKATVLNAPGKGPAEEFTIDSVTPDNAPASQFRQAYFARTGVNLSVAAEEVARGIHAVAEGLRAHGANRVLLRDFLAKERGPHDRAATNAAHFDAAGNDLQPFTVVKLLPTKP